MTTTTTDSSVGIIDAMTVGFLDALLWSDAIPLNMPADGETGDLQGRKVAPELERLARELCEHFYTLRTDDVLAFVLAYGEPDNGAPGEYCGHTFYLDAHGHGVDFTDRPGRDDDPMFYPCARLHNTAQTFSEVEHLCAFELSDGTVGL